MELVQKNIHFNRIAKEAKNQITLEEDINIPDTKEDIESVLISNYNVILEDVKVTDQKIHIHGKLVYSILYRSLETGKLCALTGSISISEQLYMEEVGSLDKITVKPKVEDFSVGMINSRKLSIQSIVELQAYIQEIYDQQISTQIEDMECECLQKECDFTQLSVCKKDILRVREMITIPNNMPNVENLVYSYARISDMEYKPSEDQLNIQGRAQILVIYDGERDSTNQVYQTTIPFGGMIDCLGANRNMISKIDYELVSSEVHLEGDYDGEARSFSVELVFEYDMKMYEPQKIDVLWDVYGLEKEIIPKIQPIEYSILSGRYEGNFKATDFVKLESGDNHPVRVLYAEGKAILDKTEMTKDGVLLKGVISCQILYVKTMEELEYGSSHFMIPFEKVVDQTEEFFNKNIKISISTYSGDLHISFDMEGNMEVMANVSYNIFIFENVSSQNITAVDVKEMDMEKYNNLPSMAVCFVSKKDTLWEMGKKYCVSLKQIRQLNQLTKEELKEGDRVLVVRG